MELIEGASLQEHFTSLKEKKEKGMGETRLWNIFIQVSTWIFCLHLLLGLDHVLSLFFPNSKVEIGKTWKSEKKSGKAN